jgi:hypothetical protein
MNYLRISILFGLFISILIISCEDEPVEPSDKELPSITKVSPSVEHQAYEFGDTAFFRINFSDNESLAEVSLRLYLITDETMLSVIKNPNSKTSIIDTFIIMNDPRFTDLDFDIKAKDAAGNVSLLSSHIHLK